MVQSSSLKTPCSVLRVPQVQWLPVHISSLIQSLKKGKPITMRQCPEMSVDSAREEAGDCKLLEIRLLGVFQI